MIIGFDSIEDIESQYEIPKGTLDDCEILLAWYGYGSYEGSSIAFIVRMVSCGKSMLGIALATAWRISGSQRG